MMLLLFTIDLALIYLSLSRKDIIHIYFSTSKLLIHNGDIQEVQDDFHQNHLYNIIIQMRSI